MSYRLLSTIDSALRDLFRDILDRLSALERGRGFEGIISFGPQIQIGDVSVTVIPNPANLPNGRLLVFRNVLTGAENTITL